MLIMNVYNILYFKSRTATKTAMPAIFLQIVWAVSAINRLISFHR